MSDFDDYQQTMSDLGGGVCVPLAPVYMLDTRKAFESFFDLGKPLNERDRVDPEDVLVCTQERGRLNWWFAPKEVAERLRRSA